MWSHARAAYDDNLIDRLIRSAAMNAKLIAGQGVT
jgi:hypothetical protein